MIPVPRPTPPPNIKRISVKDWLKGTVTAFDDGRTPTDGLRASSNVILDQDGTIRPRGSLTRYGAQPLGTILGEMFEFTKANGAVNEIWLCTVQNVGGTARVYVNKDGGAWQVCSGKTYNTTASCHFVQVDNKILVLNGIDTLSYLNIPTLTVIPFTALTQPTAPTLTTNTGLTGSTFTYYYAISANSTVGETAASSYLSVPVSTRREQWTPTSQSITISWASVANATSYNIYLASVNPTAGGTGYLLTTVGASATSFTDNNTTIQDVSTAAPAADTTAGAKATRGTVINGQVFLTGDLDNPRYVRYGGQGASVLDFSPLNGGGWSEIGRGTKEIPVRVMGFRDGKGNSQITVLCQGTNGTGKRYLLTPQTLTSGSTIISFFAVNEDNGQDGTDSPDGVVLYKDALWYPSRDGFKTTGTKPQLQNILSTDTVSETIINDVKNLNNKYMSGCMGVAWQGKIYWTVPNGSTTNNEIWVLDLARGGAWMKPWNIAASWITLYNDNFGVSHFLILSNNVIYETTNAQSSNDDGVVFGTNATSGLIKFSADSLEWAKVIDMTFILLRPQGTINFTVAGKTEDYSLVPLGTVSYVSSNNTTVAGWGEAGWGGSPDSANPVVFGWSNFQTVPVTFGSTQEPVVVPIDEECEWVSWELDTGTIGTDYQLADVIIRYVPIGIKDLT